MGFGALVGRGNPGTNPLQILKNDDCIVSCDLTKSASYVESIQSFTIKNRIRCGVFIAVLSV